MLKNLQLIALGLIVGLVAIVHGAPGLAEDIFLMPDGRSGALPEVKCGPNGRCVGAYFEVNSNNGVVLNVMESTDFGKTWTKDVLLAASGGDEFLAKLKLDCTDSMRMCMLIVGNAFSVNNFVQLHVYSRKEGFGWQKKPTLTEPKHGQVPMNDFHIHCTDAGPGVCLLTISTEIRRDIFFYVEAALTTDGGENWETTQASLTSSDFSSSSERHPVNGKSKCRGDGSKCYMVAALKRGIDASAHSTVVVAPFSLKGLGSVSSFFVPNIPPVGRGLQQINAPDIDCMYNDKKCIVVWENTWSEDKAQDIMMSVSTDGGSTWGKPLQLGTGTNPSISCVESGTAELCTIVFMSLSKKIVNYVQTPDGSGITLRQLDIGGPRLVNSSFVSCFNLQDAALVQCITAYMSTTPVPSTFLTINRDVIQLLPTPSPTTPKPTTPSPTTPKPTTPSPTTPSPTTPSPTTPNPTTPSPTTPNPTTPSPTTPNPTTPNPTTPSPTTPNPTTASPTPPPRTKTPTQTPTVFTPTTKSPTRNPSSPTETPTPAPSTEGELNGASPDDEKSPVMFIAIGVGCAAVIPIALVVKAWRKSRTDAKIGTDAFSISKPRNFVKETDNTIYGAPEITVEAIPVPEGEPPAPPRRGRFDITSIQLLHKFL